MTEVPPTLLGKSGVVKLVNSSTTLVTLSAADEF